MSGFEFDTPKQDKTNQAASAVDCPTCGGDRFVVVALRKPGQTPWMKDRGITPSPTEKIEEVAACPECNAGANVSFRRYDGREVTGMDPARVGEILADNKRHLGT